MDFLPANDKNGRATVQHAGDLEYPATDPANAPIRAEFRLGIFPPAHHEGSDTPELPPTPPTK